MTINRFGHTILVLKLIKGLKMTLSDITSAVISGNFTNEELNKVADAIKFARAQLAKQTKRSISIGSSVKFFNSRDGVEVLGTVSKINTKYVIVKSGFTNWRVPANMLEKA